MSATKSSLGNFATKLAIYPIGFFSSIIVARILGPEDRGIYTYLLLLTSFIFPIFTFGLTSGIIYFISSKEYVAKDIWYTVFMTALFFGLSISCLLTLLWHFKVLGETAKSIGGFEFFMLIGSIMTSSIFYFISRMLTGDSKFAGLNWLTIVQGLLNPILLLCLVWVLDLKIKGASLSIFLMNLICGILIIIYSLKLYQPVLDFNREFIKKSFSYGLKGWLGDMAVRANIRLDQVILGAVASPALLGIYGISVLLVELIWVIPDSIGPVLFNRIAAEQDPKERINITIKMNRTLLYISTFVGLGLALVSYYIIIPLGYGQAYSGAIVPLLILIPGSVLFIIAKVTTKLLSGSGHIAATSTAMVVGSTITIILYFILIPKYDIIGAALASSLGYVAVSAACLYQYHKHFRKDLSSLFLFRMDDFIWIKTILFSQVKKLETQVV